MHRFRKGTACLTWFGLVATRTWTCQRNAVNRTRDSCVIQRGPRRAVFKACSRCLERRDKNAIAAGLEASHGSGIFEAEERLDKVSAKFSNPVDVPSTNNQGIALIDRPLGHFRHL